MTQHLFSRLARTNLKNHKSLYLPYLLVGSVMIALFYTLDSIGMLLAQSNVIGGATMESMINTSAWLIAIIAMFVLFYSNSFVMKRRKKEFGLYHVLGMKKYHIAAVMALEVLLTSVGCLFFGIVGGALFCQLFLLGFQHLVKLEIAMTLTIPLFAVGETVLIFGALFVVVFLYNIWQVWRADPIALLHSEETGEREPKAKWFLALLGVAFLAVGYYFALTTDSLMDAIAVFFVAVLCVCLGTYCLFTAGSIAFLKCLRANKRFYYHPNHFVAVSGMMYRMKQNAVGLANICLLATCALITLSCTACLVIGLEDLMIARFPREVENACVMTNLEDDTLLRGAAAKHAEDYGVTVTNERNYTALGLFYYLSGTEFLSDSTSNIENSPWQVRLMSDADYFGAKGEVSTLEQGQALVQGSEPLTGNDFIIEDTTFSIVGTVQEDELVQADGRIEYLLLVLTQADLDALIVNAIGAPETWEKGMGAYYVHTYDIGGNLGGLTVSPDYYSTMEQTLSLSVSDVRNVTGREFLREELYRVYGSLFFIGGFFVVVFLLAMVMIIYYKQITEGFDDRARFEILQKVGMSQKQVRQTINGQVLLVFFLPLIMAGVHVAVAFPLLSLMLQMFYMTNTVLLLKTVLGCGAIFVLFYFVVYRITSRVYYQIVQR